MSVADPLPHRPVTFHRQRDVVLLHWRIAADDVAGLLPQGCHAELFDGSAWVGLVAYVFADSTVPPLPPLGRLGTMVEVVVEILVVDERGRRGTVHRSIDTQHVPAIVAARLGIGLPYRFARAGSRWLGPDIAYRSRRPGRFAGLPLDRAAAARLAVRLAVRVPRRAAAHVPRAAAARLAGRLLGPTAAARIAGLPLNRAAAARIRVRPGGGPPADDALTAFLTDRPFVFARRGGRTSAWRLHHEPWTVTAAALVELDESLLRAAGLPTSTSRPPDSVLFSPGADVVYSRS